jgi:hypothetical protein
VFNAGVQALGYPGCWAECDYEIKALQTFLEKGNPQ